MYIRDIHQELESYYRGCFAMIDDKLVVVEDFILPDADGEDDYGDPIYSNDGEYDVDNVGDLFDVSYRQVLSEMDPSNGSYEGPHRTDVLSKVAFPFPKLGLVNLPIVDSTTGFEINICKFVTREARRQWRRGFRVDEGVYSTFVHGKIQRWIGDVMGRHISSSIDYPTVWRLYNPSYTELSEAMDFLSCTIGWYALSSEWWVGQGSSGLVFGHEDCTAGDVDEDTGKFTLLDEVSFLRESLIETIGEENYAA